MRVLTSETVAMSKNEIEYLIVLIGKCYEGDCGLVRS